MMTTAINTSTTSKQVREPTDRELTEGELDQVGGGGMAISFTEVKFSYKTGDTPSTPPPGEALVQWRVMLRMEELAMTTATSTSATSRQERKPTDRELTADELERISGGRASDGKPVEFITFTIKNVTTTSIGW